MRKAADSTVAAPLSWDDATLAACRRGDRAALSRVLAAESPRVERTLSRIVGSKSDVDDLLQKTFVVAVRQFPSFRGEASVRTWLTSIAVRLAQDHVRRAKHLTLIANPEDPAPGLERTLDARRRLERLHELLGRIDAKKRVAFVLHVIEGRSMEEVAALMGASRAATKSRVWFARRQLMKALERDPLFREGER